jgi:aspartate/methionine/tyrosine aminotransferase
VSSVKRFARATKSPEIDVVTTTPSIDIMRLFLEEHAEITPHFVESRKRGRMGALDVEKLRAALRAAKTGRRTLVCLLTSPENPTGEHWPEAELRGIAEDCAELGAILIVDHTFAVSGVQTGPIPKIWDLAPTGLHWLATWDTGKTFGLNEDKLGFIIAGDKALADFVDEALAVMQFGVARRQKLFFTQVIQEAIDSDYLGELRAVCRKNLAVLVRGLKGTSIKVRKPFAGSMALLDFSATGYTDEEVRQTLLQENVGVISGNVFFHGDWVPRNYVRVALARPVEHFADAVELIAKRFAASVEK